MQDEFNRSVSPLSEAEQDERRPAEKALMNWGIGYEKKVGGALVVPGDLNISGKGLAKLPDLSSVFVGGNFSCQGNQLTSLEGAPQSVGGNFSCHDNQLTSLEGAPQTVGGNFFCHDNQLTSLEGAPQSVGGNFFCSSNQLTSLGHAPQTVGRDFFCFDNQLTSLEGAPQTVGRDFNCHSNQLTSLEGVPPKFKKLKSDFGEFVSWDAVPEELRISPETKARREQEREVQAEMAVRSATVLQSAMRVRGPLKLRSIAFRA